jgi:uncharacterized protein YjbI with pentapeptide repeats
MANQQQLATLKQGVDIWNKWRSEHLHADVDLSKTDLSTINPIEAFPGSRFPTFHRANLGGAQLSKANLSETNLHKADLAGANLSEADLRGADLSEAYLRGADLRKANLTGARLSEADLRGANLSFANLTEVRLNDANLSTAHLIETNLSKADLKGADLKGADFILANFRGANLSKTYLKTADLSLADLRDVNLTAAIFAGTNIEKAKLSGSSVCAVNVCDLVGEFEEQNDLVISPLGAPVISVDNLKIAQFIHLILNNVELRNVLNVSTSKIVLILGHFMSLERRLILDALRSKLRESDFLPVIFDLKRSTEQDFTETIKTLAGLSYFVIADVTNPKSSPLELQGTVPDYQIPFVPIIQQGEHPFAMMIDLQKKYNWVLDTLEYDSMDTLTNALKPAIIDPAIEKHNELRLIKAREPKIRTAKDFLNK